MQTKNNKQESEKNEELEKEKELQIPKGRRGKNFKIWKCRGKNT